MKNEIALCKPVRWGFIQAKYKGKVMKHLSASL